MNKLGIWGLAIALAFIIGASFSSVLSNSQVEAKKDALTRFGIDPPPGEKYRLAEKKDGKFRPLEDNNTLVDEGVENKDTLFLGTEQQVG